MAIRQQWGDDAFRATLYLLVGLLLAGTVIYPFLEGWSPLDALYFSVVTLATVGYGDLHPVTDLGKLFTILYILAGVGVIVVFAGRVVNAMVSDRSEVIQLRQERGRERREQAGASSDAPDVPAAETSEGPPSP